MQKVVNRLHLVLQISKIPTQKFFALELNTALAYAVHIVYQVLPIHLVNDEAKQLGLEHDRYSILYLIGWLPKCGHTNLLH